MISYEVYKFLHIIFILLFFISLGVVTFGNEVAHRRLFKVSYYIVLFLVFVAGMGLIARIGFKHGEPFPFWIKLKMTNWFLIGVGAFLLYRLKDLSKKLILSSVIFLITSVSIWVAIVKPG